MIPLMTGLVLSGCDAQDHHNRYKNTIYHTKHVSQYKEQQSDGTFIYWYIINSGSNNDYYGYSTSTPLRSYSGISFSKPMSEKEVREIEEEGKELQQEEAAPEETAIEETVESENVNSEPSSEGSSSESSSDSGGNSGSSDSGGDSSD